MILSHTPSTPDQFNRRFVRLFLPLVALLILILCVSYTVRVLALMRQETQNYLQTTAARMASYIDLQIQKGQENLLVAADTCAALSSPEQQLKYLDTLTRQTPSVYAGLFLEDGAVYLSQQNAPLSIAPDFLSGVLSSGKAGVTIVFPTSGADSAVLIYAAPIAPDNRTGILWIDTAPRLDRWVPASNTISACILSRDGTVLLSTGGFAENTSLFAFLEAQSVPTLGSSSQRMHTQFSAGQSGVFYCDLSGKHVGLSYTPLSQDAWMFLLSLPTENLSDTIALALLLGLALAAFIFFVFLLLIFLLSRAQRQHTENLRTFAFVDPLTGGDNSTSFSLKVQKLLDEHKTGLALVSLDIRSFSLINRAFGIQAGDDVLRHLHRCLTRFLEEGEVSAHIYVDRFDLLLHMEQPEGLRERLFTLARQFNEFNANLSTPYFLPLTAGICPVDGETCTLADLQDRANLARKEAKRRRSDQLCTCRFYSKEDHDRLQMEQSIYNRMERALAREEFQIYLQPKVSPTDGSVAGAEALVRWYDPEDGFIQPDAFIPSFERNGFIVQLDQYMFEQSCRCLRRWLDAGYDPPPISVNLSQANLSRPHFLQRYKDIQTRWNVPPHLLELELTETMISQNLDYSARLVEEIHAMGFHCSLDDFGSGYSSLNVLSRLRVDTIKLDKRFFDGMLAERDRERAEQIVSAILQLARQLGIRTVAEGVSCASQMDFLSRQPCDLIQGYHFFRPIPAAEFEANFLSPTPQKRSGDLN